MHYINNFQLYDMGACCGSLREPVKQMGMGNASPEELRRKQGTVYMYI